MAIVSTIARNKEVNKMKKSFTDPSMELILFGFDVLTTSTEPFGLFSNLNGGANASTSFSG